MADALSRIPETQEAQFFILSMTHFDFLDQLCQALHNDPAFQSLLNSIQGDPIGYTEYKVLDGLIFFKEKIWLSLSCDFKNLLLEEFHKNTLGWPYGRSQNFAKITR